MSTVGEKGINLSGGQKARVALARSFFSSSRSQIYLFDDPFSAVDGNTGNTIFQEGIFTLLKNKLRIIALNSHMHLLKHFNRIIVLDEGRIIADGSYQDLWRLRGELMERVTGRKAPNNEPAPPPLPPPPSTTTTTTPAMGESSPVAVDNIDLDHVEVDKSVEPALQVISPEEPTPGGSKNQKINFDSANSIKLTSATSPASFSKQMLTPSMSISSPNLIRSKTLIIKEQADSAMTTAVAYIKYASASLLSSQTILNRPFYEVHAHGMAFSWQIMIVGIIAVVILILIFSIAQLLRVAVDYFLAQFSAHFQVGHIDVWGIAYYLSFGLLLLSLLIRSVYLNYFAVRSSNYLHTSILRVILSAPITTFFDTHTIGSILNRFAKDVETVDTNIPEFMLQLLINWFQVISVFALAIWATYYFAAVMVILLVLFVRLYHYFSNVSRDLKQLESVTRSPIYSSLSETLTGLETIRAFGDTQRFSRNHLQLMENNQRFFFHLWISISWMTVRLELATSFILLVVALFAVLLRHAVNPIALGLTLSYGLQLTALFQRCVQLLIEMVTYMTSTERVLEYMEHDMEENCSAIAGPASSSALEHWPSRGGIKLENVYMQYRDNPSVLKGLSLEIYGGERIGICGRTGSGKSSMMVALFRIVELTSGKISIDGVDIASVPLVKLRSSLAIIPQDPILFTGDLRFQLDPFQQYSDLEIWAVLEQVNMAATVKGLPHALKEQIAEGGENLSQGQRQLLCIARALLRKAKILVVDEGTSAVDPYTDELIQRVLRDEARLHGATVLAIAHRLQTIVDFDRVLVLGDGKVLEFDSPTKLLADKDSTFAAMMKETTH